MENIKDTFPKEKTDMIPTGNQLIFNAILWLAISRVVWVDISECYVLNQTAYSGFFTGRDDSTILHILKSNEDADYENLSLDSNSAKTRYAK